MFDGSSGFRGVQMLGLMNALKTGDPIMDAMLAMMLPIVLTKVIGELGKNKDVWWSRLKFLDKRCYKRTIAFRTNTGGHANGGASTGFDEDSYNFFLIKAIKLYMHKHCHFDLQEVDLELTDSTSLAVAEGNNGRQNYMIRGMRGKVGAQNSSTSTYGMLKKCTIIQKLVKQKWHNIGTFDGDPVYIWISESSSDVSNGNNSKSNRGGESAEKPPTQSVEFRMKSDGPKSIDTFIGNAYDWYLSEMKKEEKDDRFFYDLRGFDGRHSSQRMPIFAQYKLGEDKTFDSLFSKQCHNLLKMIDQFESKSGKYSVPGYPYKLGLLLHGPPGTGKTSLIKALAHYTKRHIVNVPLSRISTNNELTTLFFNHKYNVVGNPKPAQLGYDQVIFVMEDIDAATKVVQRRDSKDPNEGPRAADPMIRPVPSSNTATLPVLTSTTRRSPMGQQPLAPSSTPRMDDDDLNLMGLLNVLDGIVETPGRIVIMTSNHPEVLDPALIRPGRIDKKLELSYMLAEDAIAMLEHYYQTNISDQEKDRIRLAVDGDGDDNNKPLKLLPAWVEQLAMEEETVQAMIGWLEEKRREERLESSCSVTVANESFSDSSLDASTHKERVPKRSRPCVGPIAKL